MDPWREIDADADVALLITPESLFGWGSDLLDLDQNIGDGPVVGAALGTGMSYTQFFASGYALISSSVIHQRVPFN